MLNDIMYYYIGRNDIQAPAASGRACPLTVLSLHVQMDRYILWWMISAGEIGNSCLRPQLTSRVKAARSQAWEAAVEADWFLT